MERNSRKTKEQLLKENDQLKAKVAKLEKSDERNRIWLENSPVCTKIIDLDFNLQFMSASGVRGLKIDDITKYYGKPYPLDFFPDSFKIPITSNLKKVKETGKTIIQEAPIVDVKGTELWYHSTLVPVYDDKDKLDYIMVVSLETTEHKHAELAIRENENRLASIYETTGDVLFYIEVISDGVYKFNSVNKSFCNATGLSEDMIIGKLVSDVIPEPALSMVLEKYKQAINENSIVRWEEASDYPAGRITGDVSIAPVFDNDGRCTHLVGSVHNITDLKNTEKKLIKEKQILANILEGTNAGTWDWNIQTGEVKLNERWAEIIGYTLKDLEPIDIKTWNDNVHPDDLPYADALLDKHFKGELDYFDVIFRQPHKNGSWIWVHARGKVIEWTEDGKPLRMSGTNLDITEQKLAEEELKKYHETLEDTIKERTKELEEKNKKLDDAMKVFVGREIKIRDLEKRIRAFEGG